MVEDAAMLEEFLSKRFDVVFSKDIFGFAEAEFLFCQRGIQL